MNSQKAGQALKEILDKCREGSVQKGRAAFKAALFDLLGGNGFADERLVLKHAMDANSFWTLLEAVQLTPDSAKKAIDRIAKESHLAKEDAEFVVRCIAAAQGVDSDIVSSGKETNNTVSQDEEAQQKTAANQNAGTRSGDSSKPETAVPQNKQQGVDSLLLSAECQINCDWARIKRSKGKVYFYKGYLRFVPDAGDVYGVKNDATEISYSDIKRFSDWGPAGLWILSIIGIGVLDVGIFAFAVSDWNSYVVPVLIWGVLIFLFLLRLYIAVRKSIVVRIGFLKQCVFDFSKSTDKKTAVSILKTWTS